MLVLAAFVQRTLSDIAPVPGVVSPTFASRSVGAVYSYDRAPASLVLFVNGGLSANPSRAFATALSDRERACGNAPARLDRGVQGRGDGRFRGRRDQRSNRARGSRPSSRSRAPRRTSSIARLAAIAATTPEDVQRVARTYMGNPTIALVLPRGANLQTNAGAMRVALVHDYLNQRGGAERVFAHFAAAWPQAPVYTALYDERAVGDLVAPERLRLSYLARIPFANKGFRLLAPFYPRAFEAFDLSQYDTIVSSTTAWAKGRDRAARRRARLLHQYGQPVRVRVRRVRRRLRRRRRAIARPVVKRLVDWDNAAAQRPTHFVANSRQRRRRIAAYYGREARSAALPGRRRSLHRRPRGRRLLRDRVAAAAVQAHRSCDPRGRAGRREAVRRRQRNGREARCASSRAERRRRCSDTSPTRGSNELLGAARAAILPGEEDFGLVPLEAAAAGRPTIAYRGGGALETIVEGETGAFFDEPNDESLAQALREFDPTKFDSARLRAHAETFSPERFVEALRAIVERERLEAG